MGLCFLEGESQKLPKILTGLSHKWLLVCLQSSPIKSTPKTWEFRQWKEANRRQLGACRAEPSLGCPGRRKAGKWFQKHRMRKALLLQIGFRKATQCICWDCWPGQNSAELSQLANNHRVQKSSALRIHHFTDSTWKKYWVGDKSQETRKTDRDVTADTFQSTWEHCWVPDARTPHLHHCSRWVPLAGQPTLVTHFSLGIYPRKSRLPPNLDFSSIQHRFSIRELTWKFSPAIRSSSEHSLLQLSCDLSHAWHSQASLKEGTEPWVWPIAPKSKLHWKDLWKTLKAAFYTLHRNGHILPTSFIWVFSVLRQLFTTLQPVLKDHLCPSTPRKAEQELWHTIKACRNQVRPFIPQTLCKQHHSWAHHPAHKMWITGVSSIKNSHTPKNSLKDI